MEELNTFDHISWIEHSNAMCKLAKELYPDLTDWVLTPTLFQNKDFTIELKSCYTRKDSTPLCRVFTFVSMGDQNSLSNTLEVWEKEAEDLLTVTLERIVYNLDGLRNYYEA